MLAPVRVSVPAPALPSALEAPEITPPTVRLFALTVRVVGKLAVLSVTAPVPIFRLLFPVKTKPPFQVWALLLVSVTAPPDVLLRRVQLLVLVTLKVPVPKAVALLILRPDCFMSETLTPPEKLLFPDNVVKFGPTIPPLFMLIEPVPVLVVILPDNTTEPLPPDKLSIYRARCRSIFPV